MSESQHCCMCIFSWTIICKTALLLMLGIGIVTGGCQKQNSCPLGSIEAKEIKCIYVYVMVPNQQEVLAVPVNDQVTIRKILDAMRPIKRDRSPMKWDTYGNLIIKLINGKEIRVSVYSTDEEATAFYLDQKYYRGGPEATLKKILETAYYDNLPSE